MKILDKKVLVDNSQIRITSLDILTPEISAKAKAGQFVVVMVDEKGERIPLTIAENNLEKGSIRLIFQETGLTTKILGSLDPGALLYALVGPLGHATEIKKYGKVILVAGGVGIAEIYPVAKALKEAGNDVTLIIGAKSQGLLILEDELREICSKLFVLTDDGSKGEKGFTTDKLSSLLKDGKYDLVYAVGPIPMMRRASLVAQEFKVKNIVSLNALMVDATGMCGCCRVTVLGQVKFSCVDGPEFDGETVDWNELESRNHMYSDSEKHICKVVGQFKDKR